MTATVRQKRPGAVAAFMLYEKTRLGVSAVSSSSSKNSSVSCLFSSSPFDHTESPTLTSSSVSAASMKRGALNMNGSGE